MTDDGGRARIRWMEGRREGRGGRMKVLKGRLGSGDGRSRPHKELLICFHMIAR